VTVALPFASIVITAYNAERFIGACVTAALAQTYPNFEVIVVDDGSIDGTALICQTIPDPRLRYLSRGRIGRQRALNVGISAAMGDYIAINDADDLSFPHRLEYTIDFLGNHSDVAYVGSGYAETDVFLASVPRRIIAEAATPPAALCTWPSRTALFRRNLFLHSTMVYPKSTWQRIGCYDEGLTNNEDYDFYLRAMQFGKAALLPGRTVLRYTNSNSFFKQKSKAEYLQALRFIKRRAHRLLDLPRWLRWYQPVWEVGFHATQHCPSLLRIVNAVRKLINPRSVL
jgi:glycosyltransferase involved in cell wall biosynthesis